MNRPRPVLTAAGISGVITSLAGVLAWLGYVAPAAALSERAQSLGSVAVVALALGGHVLAGLHAQSRVTPSADPRAADGTRLVREDLTPLAATLTSTVEASYEPLHAALDPIGSTPAVVESDTLDEQPAPAGT